MLPVTSTSVSVSANSNGSMSVADVSVAFDNLMRELASENPVESKLKDFDDVVRDLCISEAFVNNSSSNLHSSSEKKQGMQSYWEISKSHGITSDVCSESNTSGLFEDSNQLELEPYEHENVFWQSSKLWQMGSCKKDSGATLSDRNLKAVTVDTCKSLHSKKAEFLKQVGCEENIYPKSKDLSVAAICENSSLKSCPVESLGACHCKYTDNDSSKITASLSACLKNVVARNVENNTSSSVCQEQRAFSLIKSPDCPFPDSASYSGIGMCRPNVYYKRSASSNIDAKYEEFHSPGRFSSKVILPVKRICQAQVKPISVNLCIESKHLHLGPFPFHVVSDMTLKMLKMKVFNDMHIKPSSQKWILGNCFGSDDATKLCNYGIVPGSFIFLYLDGEEEKVMGYFNRRNFVNHPEGMCESNLKRKMTKGQTIESFSILSNKQSVVKEYKHDFQEKARYRNIEKKNLRPPEFITQCKSNVIPFSPVSATLRASNESVSSESKSDKMTYLIEKVKSIKLQQAKARLSDSDNLPLTNERQFPEEQSIAEDLPVPVKTPKTTEVEDLDSVYAAAANVDEIIPKQYPNEYFNKETADCNLTEESISVSSIVDMQLPDSCCSEASDRDCIGEHSNIAGKESHEEQEDTSSSRSGYDTLLQLESIDLIPSMASFECAVCFSYVEEGHGVVLRDCLHSFCRECLASMVVYTNESCVKCPYRDDVYSCNSSLQQREIKALVSADVYEQYLQHSLAVAESIAERSFHCQTPNCPGWCVYEDNINIFHCPVCLHYNCLTCGAIHEGLNCMQYQINLKKAAELDEDAGKTLEFLDKMMKEGKAMKCPKCCVVLMKKWGCDWLKCSVCQTEVCWITKGPRWGPEGRGDTSAGCKCGIDGKKCHVLCTYCH